MADGLLTRDDFRNGVFLRDGLRCVVPGCPVRTTTLEEATAKLDAHHIIERRLWSDGGYYLANGASLCKATHHMEAERTRLSVEDVRRYAGIERVVVPEHMYRDQPYDKWGNPLMRNGQRTRGELFSDESVQKVLSEGGVLGLFTWRVKYPRTFHFPWSPGVTDDDRVISDFSACYRDGLPRDVVVSVKMDGENSTLYRDHFHARSVDGEPHPSQSWIRRLHGQIAHDIPEGWRVCAENLYAKHSIRYEHLSAFAQVFSVWNDRNVCLSWDETKEWAALLGMEMVPVLYEGPFDPAVIRRLVRESYAGDPMEGYVCRVRDAFHYSEFRRVVGKYVRAGHAQTTHAWKRQAVVPNAVVGLDRVPQGAAP